MTPIDWITVITGICSIVLAIVAIATSAFFAYWSFKSQTAAHTALVEIKAQSDSLQKLSGRWMDRFTKHATRAPTIDPALARILDKMATTQPAADRVPSELPVPANVTQDTVDVGIALLYYVAVANFHVSGYVPAAEEYDEAKPFTQLVVRQTNKSLEDYQLVKRGLGRVDPKLIEASRFNYLYQDTVNNWEPILRDAATAMAQHSAPPESEPAD